MSNREPFGNDLSVIDRADSDGSEYDRRKGGRRRDNDDSNWNLNRSGRLNRSDRKSFNPGSTISSSIGGDGLRHELIRINEQLQKDLKRKEKKIQELSSLTTLKRDYQKLAEEYQKIKFFLDSYRAKEDQEYNLKDEIEQRDDQIELLKSQLITQAEEYENVILEIREDHHVVQFHLLNYILDLL
jgi:hypothetical protein